MCPETKTFTCKHISIIVDYHNSKINIHWPESKLLMTDSLYCNNYNTLHMQ